MTPVQSGRTCPPCTQRCRQGRDCPARAVQGEGDDKPLGFFVGLLNGLLVTAAAFGVAAVLAWLVPGVGR